eukprot:TRINITY_DN21898_c0_g1_i1.p1 TRINITY_DN21898_c0_g1~~TRINITY_DN21898_c0_g1_i1.p1  ORF type:complete len:466 (+),score=56.71 TRINITY_DN21898_c0_g1_i1:105-1502(+)
MSTVLYNEVERLYEMVATGDATPEMKLLSSLLGTGKEADEWLGYTGFWVEGSPKVVEDAIERLPVELQEDLWWDALDSAVTIRSLQLIRLTTCYSGNKKIPKMPIMPIPESWLQREPDSTKLGIHVDVGPITESPDPCWSNLVICISVSSKVELKLLNSNIKLTSNFLVTHPNFRQSRRGKTLTGTNTQNSTIDALIVGKVRYFGHCSAVISDSSIDLESDADIRFLRCYISELLQLPETEVSVTHKRGNVVNIWFPKSPEPKKLQLLLLQHQSDFWDEIWECGSEIPDLQVQFPGRPCIKIAVSGREGSSPFVADEIMRQSVLTILQERGAGWKEAIVTKLTSSGMTSPFAREMLWCIIGGLVDLSDPYEVEAMMNSIRGQCFVPNRKPKFQLSTTPHKSHELFKKHRNRLRDGITLLHSKLILCLPYIDPITASQMGVCSPSDDLFMNHQPTASVEEQEIEFV